MSDLKEELTYRAYAAGWAVVRRLPEKPAYKLFEKAADRSWRKRGKSVRRLESNLARVLGPDASEARIREVSKQGMRNYMRYYCDTFRLETWSRQRIESTMTVLNEDKLRELLAEGNGVVLALPHMGNWDHAGAWAARVAADGFTTVAERLKPEKLFERFLRYRESIGMEVLPLTGGTGTFAGLMRRLRSGGLVCLVAERDLTDSGVPVRFFGETTKLPAGPAALAVATGAALCPVTLWYDGPHHYAKVWPRIPVPAEGRKPEKIAVMCQAVADVFAQGIAEHPADWHMLQRLWLVDLDPARVPGAATGERVADPDAATSDTADSANTAASGSAEGTR
ncbi:phosphatidylinositol mannoside acyltransferase [Actinospica durhamensis]|uniref:Phosphatidylinositol mannoside acyltransferase n=1 Tax=Actinospica durhamensis TaxID=1508375 RepID=A0A941EXU3_9ACTN|nr:phosphatidylinositol mannoside acyltransferase [Actinospica durhamensis]MBR7839001.1 phosphatidylinositol mannoside acyltransferase [Actinospica durhamensis]